MMPSIIGVILQLLVLGKICYSLQLTEKLSGLLKKKVAIGVKKKTYNTNKWNI
jgi:hypothetical protein